MRMKKRGAQPAATGGAGHGKYHAGGSLTPARLICNRPGCRCRRRPGPGGCLRVHCPSATHPTPGDPGPSLSIKITGGKLRVIRCWANCPREAILQALGIQDGPPDPPERPATRREAPWDPSDALAPVHEVVWAACRCTGHQHPWRLHGGTWLGDCPVPGCQREFEYTFDLLRPGCLWVWCRGVDDPCPPEAIYKALGLPPDGRLYGQDGKLAIDGRTYHTDGGILNPETWLLEYCRLDGLPDSVRPHLRFTGSYVCFLFQGARVEKWRGAGTKEFKWVPAGQKPPHVVLWPVPDAALPETIFLTEGELDAVVLRAAGLEAFSVTDGAETQVPLEIWGALKLRGARRVVLVMDADDAGRRGAERIAEDIRSADLEAVNLNLVRAGLADVLAGEKDVRDLWRSGRFQDLDALRKAVLRAVRGIAPEATPLSEADGPGETTYLWRPYVPRRHLTLLEGPTDAGKTWVALHIALLAARGRENVLYVTDEHDAPELKDRLLKMGATDAELKCVFFWGDPTLEGLEAEARRRPYGLIVVDPITDLVPARLNPNLPTVGRAVLSPLRRLAAETGAAVLAIRHWGKAVNSDVPALARGLGSTAFAAKARSILHVGRLPKAATAYALVHLKHNLGPRGPAFEYRLDPEADPPFQLIGVCPDLTPQDIGLSDVERSELDRAVRWLRTMLADGPKPAKVVLGLAQDDGIAERTLHRAKAVLGVVSLRVEKGWAWKLPDSPDGPGGPPGDGEGDPGVKIAKTDPLYMSGNLGNLGRKSSTVADSRDCQSGPLDGNLGNLGNVGNVTEDTPDGPTPEGNPGDGDGDLPFLFDGASPEGPPWPLDTFEPALNPGPVPCTACGYPIAAGMAVRSRLDLDQGDTASHCQTARPPGGRA